MMETGNNIALYLTIPLYYLMPSIFFDPQRKRSTPKRRKRRVRAYVLAVHSWSERTVVICVTRSLTCASRLDLLLAACAFAEKKGSLLGCLYGAFRRSLILRTCCLYELDLFHLSYTYLQRRKVSSNALCVSRRGEVIRCAPICVNIRHI